jgi:hypothetical protein
VLASCPQRNRYMTTKDNILDLTVTSILP